MTIDKMEKAWINGRRSDDIDGADKMNNIHMGKLIAGLRLKNGMSQKTLAEKLNVSPSTLCKWENGRNMPDFDSIRLISDIFQISGDELLRPEVALHRMKDEI